MKKTFSFFFYFFALIQFTAYSQSKDQVIEAIVKEANDRSQLEKLGHELIDVIGPRLVGTPQMLEANQWVEAKYKTWDIEAKNEAWGKWLGWERGITHIDMVAPWVKSLHGTQLAWSPSTNGKIVTAEVIIIPDFKDSLEFQNWLPTVKGKFVLVSMLQPTGRPDYNWEENGTKESIAKMKREREEMTMAWAKRIQKTGYTSKTLPKALEAAGALGVFSSYWSKGFGANKIFGANTEKVPSIDISQEDYGLLFRLAQSGNTPKISLRADSKSNGTVPTFNTIGMIKGSELPNEYVILSAHLDSWDGGTGATDNGTGTITMMEAMRILKKVYPNPKRTILVGHWGSEEQGLNGSRAFVEDHPEIVNNIQALFNQDNGTGRVVDLAGQGFVNSYNYLGRWLAKVPADIRKNIVTSFPGSPGAGGSDFASFVAAGAPAFSLTSLSWSYGIYTWHTNLDTYDKIVFDDVRNNVITTAIMAYEASEDPERSSNIKRVMPNNSEGKPAEWPTQRKANRVGN